MNSELANIKSGVTASYMDNDDAGKELSKQGYTLDEQLSGQRAKVFLDPSGKPHIAYRGTVNRHDVLTDAAIMLGLGKYMKRTKHTKKVLKDVERKYNQDANVMGHSLGGYLAENSGAHGNVTTYNKLATGRNKYNKKQTDIRTNKDFASLLTKKHKNNILINSKSYNPFVSHSTKSLKDRNRF